jgi:A/G-specific adenine glycosylase
MKHVGALKEKKHFRSALLDWFDASQRSLPWRGVDDPYLIWISEVMLQQTQVATVIPYFNRFIRRFPTVRHLAEAPEDTLLKSWEGLGYYARIRNLQSAARTVVAEHNGIVPRDPATFRALKGVGDYIAAAVGSIAFDIPLPVVDGNVKRVISRLEREPLPVNHFAAVKTFGRYAEELLDKSRPGTFNQAMMELGALVCTPRKPTCDTCPVSAFCDAATNGETDVYPKRKRKPPIPTHHIAVGVIWKNDRVLVTKRSPKGLLGGLWEFPGGKIATGEPPRAACIREIREETNLHVTVRKQIASVKHAYTHFKIVMDVFDCRYRAGEVRLKGPVDYKWVSLDALAELPFPGANNKFIPLITPPDSQIAV